MSGRVSKTETGSAPTRRKTDLKRHRRPQRGVLRVLLLLVAGIIVVDSLVGNRGLLAMVRARHEYDAVAASVARQRAENARLRELARRLKEDPLAIEEIARRNLGLIKPGEKVFIIKDVLRAAP
jgi:cell division protein FtsB